MGYIRHDAIVVTSWKPRLIDAARNKAVELGMTVSEVIESPTNGYSSFLIAPDGSKEGWESSYRGDDSREEWVAWMRLQPDNWVDWVAINYGGDEPCKTHLVDFAGKDGADEGAGT